MMKTSALPLSDLAYVRVQGPDAEGFLQGQLSNDLRLLTATQSQLAAYSSPKGRMLAVLTLFRHGDDIVLELHRSLLDSVLKRLRMFVLRSKVTLQDAGSSLPALGLIGEDAGAPGQSVYAAGDDGQAIGEVVDAVADGDGRLLVLAVLQLGHAGSTPLALGSAGGPPLHLMEPVAEGN